MYCETLIRESYHNFCTFLICTEMNQQTILSIFVVILNFGLRKETDNRKVSDKSREKCARVVRCMHNLSHSRGNWNKTRERARWEAYCSARAACRGLARSCATPARIFYRKEKICVTDEIVLMGPASSLTRPREKQREEEEKQGILRMVFTTRSWT